MGFLKNLFSRKARRQERAARILLSPDRKVLADNYLPAFAALRGRVLFVGCREYTTAYYDILEAQGGEVWTMDIDPAAAPCGHLVRHHTGDVCAVDQVFADMKFDGILCNGVLGYGVDSPEQQRRALTALAAAMVTGGHLLIGWNTHKIEDPLAAGMADGLFEPEERVGLPARVPIVESRHVYDSLIRL
jgi:hypothetical protein